MDDAQINNYIASLPQPIQDMIADVTWQNKTDEIGKKYGLQDSQRETLANDVLLVITGIEKPETFTETIQEDLGISKLLAEQLVEDLEARVFEYVLKQIEPRAAAPKPVTPQNTRIPEVKPNNLPMVEIGNTTPQPAPQQYKTSPSMRAPEMAQKPYGVPRFGMASIPPKVQTLNLNQTRPETAPAFMENKLNSVTVNMGDNFIQKGKPADAPKQAPPTKYTSDPYREPLS